MSDGDISNRPKVANVTVNQVFPFNVSKRLSALSDALRRRPRPSSLPKNEKWSKILITHITASAFVWECNFIAPPLCPFLTSICAVNQIIHSSFKFKKLQLNSSALGWLDYSSLICMFQSSNCVCEGDGQTCVQQIGDLCSATGVESRAAAIHRQDWLRRLHKLLKGKTDVSTRRVVIVAC